MKRFIGCGLAIVFAAISCSKDDKQTNVEGYWKLTETRVAGKVQNAEERLKILHFSATEIREYRTGMKDFANNTKYRVDGKDIVVNFIGKDRKLPFTMENNRLVLTMISISIDTTNGNQTEKQDTVETYERITQGSGGASGMISEDQKQGSGGSTSPYSGGYYNPGNGGFGYSYSCSVKCVSGIWQIASSCESGSCPLHSSHLGQSCGGGYEEETYDRCQ